MGRAGARRPGNRHLDEGGRCAGEARPRAPSVPSWGGIEAVLVLHNRDLFAAWRIEAIAHHYLRLLRAIVATPDEPLETIDLLSAEERTAALHSSNETAQAVPITTLPQLFRTQAARTPDAVAVMYRAESLTYAAVQEKAGRLAGLLRRVGVGPDVVVAVCVERSLDLVIAVLGVLEAGGAYVAVDPRYPSQRIAYMLEDSGAAVVLAQSRTLSRVQGAGRQTICVDDWMLENEPGETSLDHDAGGGDVVGPAHLAYLLYTSGSTGRPKGVMVSHRAICNHMAWMLSVFPLGPDDRVLQRTSTSFDASVWELFAPLLAGARLVLAPSGHHGTADLTRWICEQEITVVQMVPSLFRVFAEHPQLDRCVGLRRVFCGGEALPASSVRQFLRRLPHVELHNLYGPTEAAIDASAWHCTIADEGVSPIGRPIWNTQFYVLDEGLAPVPHGVRGELYIAGDGLARGYRNMPGQTADRFVPDAYGGISGGRMYRTGDLVRWRPDGVLEFLGRVDHQVKVRGFRIELAEIEAALRANPAVEDTVVVPRDDGSGDKQLIAYIVERTGYSAIPGAIRSSLAARLPDHMIPAAVVVLDAFPRAPNGKLNVQALPAPAFGSSCASRPPRTQLERAFCAIFAEVLGVDRVGLDDDFFQMGGHSLSAMRVISRIRYRLGIDLSLRTLLERGSVAGVLDGLAATRVSAAG